MNDLEKINIEMLSKFSAEYFKSRDLPLLNKFYNFVNTNDVGCRDFKMFPNLPNVRKTNLHPIFSNNDILTAYYSQDDLPNGYRFIEELKNKGITYVIICEYNGLMPYFGHTTDIFQRGDTHSKDGRTEYNERELYVFFRNVKGKAIFKILDVFEGANKNDNKKQAHEKEVFYIRKYRELIGTSLYNQRIWNYSETEIRERTKNHMFNILMY